MELLYIAQCFKIPIAEVAVNWTEIEGGFLMEHVDICPCVMPVIWGSINTSAGRGGGVILGFIQISQGDFVLVAFLFFLLSLRVADTSLLPGQIYKVSPLNLSRPKSFLMETLHGLSTVNGVFPLFERFKNIT